jgi:hypothetical protein
MSTFESNAITLLKGIYDNIGTGVPYKSIQGFFTQEDDGSVYPITYTEAYNDAGLTLTIDSQGLPGSAAFTIPSIDVGIYDDRKTSIILSSPLHPTCIFSSDLVSTNDPYENRIVSVNTVSSTEDPRGFGSSTGNTVYFEMRFYPIV